MLADRAASAVLALTLAAAVAVGAFAAAGLRPHVEASDSMAPLLRAGDVLWLDEIDAADARRGDVIAFSSQGRAILHRVAGIAPVGAGRLEVTTKGDATSATETWTVGAQESLGRFTGLRIPSVGRATGGGSVVAGAAASLLLAGLGLRAIWR